MSDMFSRSIGYAGTLKPETAFFSSTSGLGSGLVTGVNIQYQQQMSRMWSLFGNGTQSGGNARVWLVAGDTQGSMQLGALYGAGSVSTGTAGDLCNPGKCSLTATGSSTCGSSNGGGVSETLTMDTCVVSSYGFSGNSGNMQISQDVGIAFISMSRGS